MDVDRGIWRVSDGPAVDDADTAEGGGWWMEVEVSLNGLCLRNQAGWRVEIGRPKGWLL